MPLDHSCGKESFSRNVSQLMHDQYPQKQALAIAYRIKRERKNGGRSYDDGGAVDPLTGAVYPSEAAQAKFGRIADAVGTGLRNWIEYPGRVMEGGQTLEDMTNWTAPTALGMIGAPGVPAGATGSAFRYSLFHGSPHTGLTVLDESTRGPLGPGVYTSPAKQIADSYGRSGVTYELPPRDRDIFRGAGHRTDEEWFGFKDDKARLLAAAEPDKRADL